VAARERAGSQAGTAWQAGPVKTFAQVFRAIHSLMALLFACAALLLIVISARAGWQAVAGALDAAAAQAIIEAVGLLAAAVVALQIAETIFEEEVIRAADISAPTRVRRFLSRFFVVVVVSLAIEGLVATFKALHENPAQLPYAASILCATGVLLAAWGLFVHLNRSAEELEPEAMADAKQEDRKLK
jgi:TRAP-type mannitol/chloroaromatic compound transport system permease small subunit